MQEEKQFATTLSKGLKILDKELEESDTNKIDGQLMFQLYDTYGFPPDLTIDIAKERDLGWDMDGFNAAMLKQRELSQQSQHFNRDQAHHVHLTGETVFTGYNQLEDDAKVVTILHDSKPIGHLKKGEKGIVVLDKTPFYAESGGQIGDTGLLHFKDGLFEVTDTQKKGAVILHHGKVKQGELANGDLIHAEVNAAREQTKLNHSATHLLHEALRRVLGEHVQQKGSLVDAKRLRFDFSHTKALTQDEIYRIEKMINDTIRLNVSLHTETKSLEEAKKSGAMALFSEKYADEVRVVRMGDFSTEICGGTHATRTGDIGLFKIMSESASASGVRRIEAVTGIEAFHYVSVLEKQLQDISGLLKTSRELAVEKIAQVLEQNKQLTKELSSHKQKSAHQNTGELSTHAVKVGHASVLIEMIKNADRESLRHTIDQLKPQLGDCVILLATVQDEKVVYVAAVSSSLTGTVKAADLLKAAGAKGGGRPDMAQGGSDDPSGLHGALETVRGYVKSLLG